MLVVKKAILSLRELAHCLGGIAIPVPARSRVVFDSIVVIGILTRAPDGAGLIG